MTLTPQHAPGPWKYHLGRGASPRFHIQTVGGHQIASTPELERHPQAHEQNAYIESNAKRIVDCINALAHIPNPAAVKECVEALKNLIESSRAAYCAAYCGPQSWSEAEREALRVQHCNAERLAEDALSALNETEAR